MDSGWNSLKQLANLLYKLKKISRPIPLELKFRVQKPAYGMLLVDEAEGSIRVDGRCYALQSGKAFFFAPNSEVQLDPRQGSRMDGCFVQFYAWTEAQEGHMVHADASFPPVLQIPQCDLLIAKLKEAEKKCASPHPWEVMEANILFQEVIRLSFHNQPSDRQPSDLQAVYLAKHYMERNYRSDITREILISPARSKGISGKAPWHF